MSNPQEVCPFCHCQFALKDMDRVSLKRLLPPDLAQTLRGEGPPVHRAHYLGANLERRLKVLAAALAAEQAQITDSRPMFERVKDGPSFALPLNP